MMRRIAARSSSWQGRIELMRVHSQNVPWSEHVPVNAMSREGEIARFYDRCTDLMRELLDGLAEAPDRPRPFPQIEDAIGWPRRRVGSRLGGVSLQRPVVFDGRRPYHFHEPQRAQTRR